MSEKAEINRGHLAARIRSRPFRQFTVHLEDGSELLIRHPENVGFDPVPDGDGEAYILAANQRVLTSLEAITRVATEVDQESAFGSETD